MRIEHVALYVEDLERARDFFIRYFDGISNEQYHNKKTGFRSYFISFEDGCRLEIMNREHLKECDNTEARKGFIHIAFSVGSKEKVDAMTENFIKDGFEVISGPRTTGDGYYESCIVDLEGNQIEITE